MARPPLPIGTIGKIRTEKLGPNRHCARARFRDHDGKTREVEATDATGPAAKTELFANPWASFDEAKAAVAMFKHYVEHQDGYTLINRGGGKPFASEKEVQTFFGLLLAPSRFDVNREPNNGRGPVDFKLSKGGLDKSLIEFKLAKSTSLRRNLENQVAIYEEANRTNQSMKVIIAYTDADIAKVTTVLTEVGLASDPTVVVIDARSKQSASKV